MKIEELKLSRKVRMVNCYEAKKYGNKIWETIGEPWECCGAVVVKLKGKNGGFDINKLEAIKDKIEN